MKYTLEIRFISLDYKINTHILQRIRLYFHSISHFFFLLGAYFLFYLEVLAPVALAFKDFSFFSSVDLVLFYPARAFAGSDFVTDFLGLAAGIEAFFYNLGAGSALLEAYL
jgi:hypothetical protein